MTVDRADVSFPVTDQLWPAIWMLPVNDTYGPWPLSGEIDIMESRGNGRDYPDQCVPLCDDERGADGRAGTGESTTCAGRSTGARCRSSTASGGRSGGGRSAGRTTARPSTRTSSSGRKTLCACVCEDRG